MILTKRKLPNGISQEPDWQEALWLLLEVGLAQVHRPLQGRHQEEEAAADRHHGRDPPPEEQQLRGQEALRPARQDLQGLEQDGRRFLEDHVLLLLCDLTLI